MNHWKYITILMTAIGMVACQSQTEQISVAPAETAAPEAARQAAVHSTTKTSVPVIQKEVKKAPPVHAAKPAAPAAANTTSRVVSKPEPKTVTAPPKTETPRPAIKKTAPIKVDMKVLNKCKSCHDLSAKNKVGPGLGKGKGIPGVFNRKAGTIHGFRYKFTKYIKGSGWNWDETHLREWICNSKKALRKFTGDTKAKTKMPSQRICNPAKQDAVIVALKSIS